MSSRDNGNTKSEEREEKDQLLSEVKCRHSNRKYSPIKH